MTKLTEIITAIENACKTGKTVYLLNDFDEIAMRWDPISDQIHAKYQCRYKKKTTQEYQVSVAGFNIEMLGADLISKQEYDRY